MKRLSFTIALCFAVGFSFAQKKTVNSVKNELKSDKPNISDARTLIKGALEDPETKDDAGTWYVAGLVENKQFDMEKTKEILGQKPDEKVMFTALGNILPFFLKADELDQKPDEKGKIKPKYGKDMKSILLANRAYYINGGAFYFDNTDYKMAYDFFQQYLDIPKLDLLKGEDIISKDTLYPQIKYYAAIAATQVATNEEAGSDISKQYHQKAITAYESLKNDNYKGNEVYQYLCYEYEQVKDTARLIETLKEGVQKFPSEPYYLLSLINQYIYSNKNDEAIAYLTQAIERKPNDPQLQDVLGRIYENKKDVPKATECFEKALTLDPNYVESIGNLGRVYFNEGVETQAAANDISDNKKYQELNAKAKDLFKKALPYFEKAHQIKPDEKEYMVALRGIYYNLNMGKEYDEIDAQLNKASN